ncbi:hypothetical protein EGW08_008062 [Elysia chlorotica]|uniref:Uncharacterized protein n=1 Tax=Elysia chlorotica TaxID=188477 RepID=A0A433TRF5_ELYCH|nr:hypothetical protein EGW08_008062 [Elysia chlorotica]
MYYVLSAHSQLYQKMFVPVKLMDGEIQLYAFMFSYFITVCHLQRYRGHQSILYACYPDYMGKIFELLINICIPINTCHDFYKTQQVNVMPHLCKRIRFIFPKKAKCKNQGQRLVAKWCYFHILVLIM